jgi:hypothetical protein
MDGKRTESEDVVWMYVAHHKVQGQLLVNTVMNLKVQ